MSGGLSPDVAAVFLKLGHPYPTIGHLAYDEMHPDDIVLNDSGVLLTVGDIRALQAFLLNCGHTSPDRLTEILTEMPTKGAGQ